ncbi:MAG: cell surface protein SprA [Bacteroidetes bacterium]|nr:cell surface protein SprA [Bacteroidota bacterium]
MSIDSTARLKYFRYERKDVPYVQLKLQNESSFYAQPSANTVTRTISVDSTGKFVEIKELVGGKQTKILLRMPIDEYIKLKLALNEEQLWDQLAGGYELKSSKKELGQLIKDITNLEIPLPSVGVLSIFGKPKISLRIGGAVDIHGAWRNETTQGVTASLLGNTRNEPDFKQQVQINVNGTIGDKLNIAADWNTERTFEYQNQLHIKYTGYEDEIIQSVEAGNVSMQASPLVGGSEALFGVKAELKLGPLSLTTLASQKKGEVKEVAVNGGATSQTFSIRAYNYATNNFFIDTAYASPSLHIFYDYYGNAVPTTNTYYNVNYIEVWKSVNTQTIDKSKERQVNAYLNLPPMTKSTDPNLTYSGNYSSDTVNPVPGQIETGRFVLLQPDVDYTVHPQTGYITFNTQIQDQDAIAVAYVLQGSAENLNYGETLAAAGSITSSDSTRRLVLKLIKPAYLKPQFTQAWKLLLKNIYPVGGTNIKQDGFDLQIKYETPGADPVTIYPNGSLQVQLLNAFGLDRYDASGNANPDGVFDWKPQLTVLPTAGEIIFPTLEPFGKNLPSDLPDSLAYQSVYDTTQNYAQQDKSHDKWEITGKYSGEATSVYQLGFNVVENSVRVTLNGRQLVANTDYTVDYNIGQLTILNRDALVPGADLKISYEQNDLFTLASKTLLGMRGVLNISNKTKLGFSLLNLNQQTLSDKVRIGEEPLSNTIMGVDFSTGSDLPFLTNALDHVISTKQMSSFSLAGEFAYIKPNPNTKISTIPADNGQSIAYIDDFEGAKKLIPIGVSYTSWKDLSPPDSLSAFADSNFSPGEYYKNILSYKGKAWWYSITPSNVLVPAIWGTRKKVATQDQQVPVMDFVFDPDTPGTYNWNPKLQDPKKNWGGMMKVLSGTANDLQAQNIQYIEFWLNEQQVPANGKIYIDLGRISEDVIPNRVLDTEDKNGNSAIDQGEDTGIDGLTDAQEKDAVKAKGYYTWTKADPSGDDFSLGSLTSDDIWNYFNINGTEGNAINYDLGRIPDTEDLNYNGNLDLVNSYFRYEVPLDTNEIKKRNLLAGGGDQSFDLQNKWYLIRIPLQDTALTVGNPTLSDVEYIRLFTTGVDSIMHLRLAEFNLVGNQWQQALPYDTVMSVSVINIEDNPNYSMPPGISQERDHSQPQQDVYLNEQSMDLILKGLQPGEDREAVKYLYRPLDVFNYSALKFFIHGDESPGASITDTTGGQYPAQVYFRFGSDTNNFYEYRQPVQKGWNDVNVVFSKLTAIKQSLDSAQSKSLYQVQVPGEPGHFYGVKGNPTLTSIRFLTVGIVNVSDNSKFPKPVSGELWVDELRVVGADNHPGWAYSVSTSFKLADLMNINFNMSQTDPYFHRLSDQFGSRVDTKNWSLAADMDLMKLIPMNLPGSSLRLSYSHTESIGKPLYLPGTDIKVDEAAARANQDTIAGHLTGNQLISNSQTVNVSDSWSASNIALRIPSSSWIVQNTINALTLGFNFNKTFGRNPTTLSSKMWVWNANLNYGINFSPEDYFYPANIPIIGTLLGFFKDYRNLKIYYAPQNFAFTFSARRNRSITVNRQTGLTPVQAILSHDFSTSRGFNFGWKFTEGGLFNLSTNYNVSVNSSLAYLEANNSGNLIPEREIWREILSGNFFGKDFQYQQSLDFRTNPKLPSIWDIDRYFSLTANYSVGYQWNNNFSQKINGYDAGRSAGFNNKSQVGLRLALKSIMDPLFAETTENPVQQNQRQPNFENNRDRNFNQALGKNNPNEKNNIKAEPDTLAKHDSLATSLAAKKSPITNALLFLKAFAKIILFDYESISINFSNDNNVSKSALKGKGTGFNNFWGLTYNQNNGPSRLFMLGLSSDVGLRTPNLGSLTDVFAQRNNLDMQTSRPLWEGAKIDLSWKLGWTINKSATFQSDQFGNISSTIPPTETGSITRSFFTLPPVLFLSVFKSGIKRVSQLYDPNSSDRSGSLSQAFIQGFESLPFLSRFSFLKNFANYIPRPNWTISWDGLEKYYPFKSIAERVSLDHSYSSTYTEGWQISTDGTRMVQTQRIDYGFQPLVGLNMTFAKLWDGNLSGSIKYSIRESFDLGLSTQNITESSSKDIGLSASYSKTGFEIPIFGLALKNDIEFTFSYTNSQSSMITYDMNNYVDGGTPTDGTSRITIEPRVKYTISSKVTLAVFYTRSTVEPVGASRIPPTTTNEAGLDVHISIQ